MPLGKKYLYRVNMSFRGGGGDISLRWCIGTLLPGYCGTCSCYNSIIAYPSPRETVPTRLQFQEDLACPGIPARTRDRIGTTIVRYLMLSAPSFSSIQQQPSSCHYTSAPTPLPGAHPSSLGKSANPRCRRPLVTPRFDFVEHSRPGSSGVNAQLFRVHLSRSPGTQQVSCRQNTLAHE